jgi:hypothetical protein
MSKLTLTAVALLISGASFAESNTLATQNRRDIGLSFSGYSYSESGARSLKGPKLGFDFGITHALRNDQFIHGEVHYGFGKVSLSGKGTASGQQDWYIDAREMWGTDVEMNDAVLAPYIGLGYRFLFNDGRGAPSPSVDGSGYRRESTYVTLPIGITHRSTIKDQAKLVNTFEYATLLTGKQFSRLSDMDPAYHDLSNNQRSGYGLRLSVMYEQGDLSVGPFVNYWKIPQSDSAPVLKGTTINSQRAEPQNNTVEVGIKASKQF